MARAARKIVMSEEPEPSGLATLLQQLPDPAFPAGEVSPSPRIPGGAPTGSEPAASRTQASDQGGGPDAVDQPGRDPDAPDSPDDPDPPRREPGDEDEDRLAHQHIDDWPDGGGRRPAIDGEIIPSGGNPAATGRRPGPIIGPIRYESRIRILEAYQYRGLLADAPGWVDRNWMAHGDYDPLRNIEAGPALRVPTPRGDYALVRPGDYVVRQEVVLAAGLDPDVQLECWPQESFERLFIPSP